MNKYSRTVQWSESDQAYIALCPELSDISAFGDTPEEALVELNTVIEMTVDIYAEKGWPVPEPSVVCAPEYSGQFRTRLPRSLHERLARRAESEGVSQNTLVVAYVAAGLSGSHVAEAAIAEFSMGLRPILHRLNSSLTGLGGAVSSVSAMLAGYSAEASTTTVKSSYQDPVLRRIYADAAVANA